MESLAHPDLIRRTNGSNAPPQDDRGRNQVSHGRPSAPRDELYAPASRQVARLAARTPFRTGKSSVAVIAVVGLVALICLGGAGVLLMKERSNRSHRAAEEARRLRCQENFRAIFTGLSGYAQYSDDFLPPHLSYLILPPNGAPVGAAWVEPSSFICPDDTRNTVPPSAPKEFAEALGAGGHCSYVYARDGDRIRVTSLGNDEVLLYEPLEDHQEGAHFLYATGVVRWLPKDEAARLIASLAKGAVSPAPPRTPAQAAATAPAVPGWTAHEAVGDDVLVSVEAPPDWHGSQGSGKAVLRLGMPPGSPSAGATVYVFPAESDDVTPVKFLPGYLSTYQPGSRVLRSDQLVVTGRPAARAVFETTLVKGITLAVVVHGRACVLVATVSSAHFDEMESTLDQMARTLKIEDGKR